MDCSSPGFSVHGDSPGKNTGEGCHVLLQGIFPTQGLNPGLPHCRWILYHLSHQGSPRILEWVAYPFSRGIFWPRSRTGVSCIAGGLFLSAEPPGKPTFLQLPKCPSAAKQSDRFWHIHIVGFHTAMRMNKLYHKKKHGWNPQTRWRGKKKSQTPEYRFCMIPIISNLISIATLK